MLAKVHSAAVLGIDAYPIEIEVNYSGWGKPNVIIVGLPVKQRKDRRWSRLETGCWYLPRTVLMSAHEAGPNRG